MIKKKGMSPLLATLLLIAFAISLGILIMSLGDQMRESSGHGEINMTDVCSGVAFEIVSVDNISSLCYDNEAGEISLIGVNRGKPIQSMQVWVIGKRLYKTELLDEPLSSGMTIEKQVAYDVSQYGEIEKIKLIPRINDLDMDKPVLCTDYPIEINEINKC
ncbi:MAG: archaellin/type IV pilin N-terminal domain-containing protein [Candidatus Woesearchaeota archaeon]